MNKKRQTKAQAPLKAHKIRIRVVGLGGGGTSIVSEMAQSLSGVSFVVADTDERVFKKAKKGIRVFQFGSKVVGGRGTGMNIALAEKAALEDKEKIKKIFQGQDLSIIVSSLGGGVASGSSIVFAAAARELKNSSIGIFTLPFQFEGEKKMKLAKKALEKLKQNLSAVIVVPNERIFMIADKKAPLKKSLSAVNQMIAAWLSELIEIISKPSLINIDFADLKSILKGQGETLFFGQATASGHSRADEAVKKIFQNPLLGDKPTSVKRILFNISGGKDLGIKEIETISRQIASLNSKAKIIFGITQLPKYNGKIKVVLMALSGSKPNAKPPRVKFTNSKKKRKKIKMDGNNNRNHNVRKHSKEEISKPEKEGIRRSAVEIKQEEKEEVEKDWQETTEWETPAFMNPNNKQQ